MWISTMERRTLTLMLMLVSRESLVKSSAFIYEFVEAKKKEQGACNE